MNILSNVSKNLKDLMEEAETTAHKRAAELDTDPSVISKFLRAERLPSAATLVMLADYFNCTTDYILGLSDILDNRTFKSRPPFNEQLTFLLDYFKVTKYGFSKATGISEEAIGRWHSGKFEPTVESLVKIARQYSCSVDFLLGRE